MENTQAKVLALSRIAVGLLFVIFGSYKVFWPTFVESGMEKWIAGYIANSSYPFYKPFLVQVVAPHIKLFAYLVGLGELTIGLSLIFGALVNLASFFGLALMINLGLASGYRPDMVFWQYFGASLAHIALGLWFIAFWAASAGNTWGLDPLLARYLPSRLIFFPFSHVRRRYVN
jgi:uncharacterized membrane protein YphA (DoxX/SURF4 family)